MEWRWSTCVAVTLFASFAPSVCQMFPSSDADVGNIDTSTRRELYTRSIQLSPSYHLNFSVDWETNRINFNVTTTTSGWIMFGLAKRGGLENTNRPDGPADLIIGGGSGNDDRPYLLDMYTDSLGVSPPRPDASQDWNLESGWSENGRTSLSFSRNLDTCDTNDIPITEDTLTILFASGEGFDNRHSDPLLGNHGEYMLHMLDPIFTPAELPSAVSPPAQPPQPNVRSGGKGWSTTEDVNNQNGNNLQVFNISASLRLPPQDTAYWCTFHRMPTVFKHHITGFNVTFPNGLGYKHIHHLLLHRCTPPDDTTAEQLFEGPSRTSGSECYFYDQANIMPIQWCRETIHIWGVGMREYFFPDHVGLPMSETGREYLMLQVHYDNPDEAANLDVDVSINTYYTPNLREHDVAMLAMGNQIPAAESVVIPPNSKGHVTVGMCAPGCTERYVPEGGLKFFAGWLHTHTTGRNVRFMQIRGDEELPWLLFDYNYNFNFQQLRNFRRERTLLPGDQLIERCAYDTTERNGDAVVGGFGTQEAMCTGHFYYYRRVEGFSMCRSVLREEQYLEKLNVRNTTWDESRRQQVVTSPRQFAGLTMFEHVNRNVNWTPAIRRGIQWDQLFLPQYSQCPNTVLAHPVPPRVVQSPPSPQPRLRRLDVTRRPRTPPQLVYPPLAPQPNAEILSSNPRNIIRWQRPGQCSKPSLNTDRDLDGDQVSDGNSQEVRFTPKVQNRGWGPRKMF